MKALSEIKLPHPAAKDTDARRSADTNQLLLNKNFRQIQDTIRDLEERVKELEAR